MKYWCILISINSTLKWKTENTNPLYWVIENALVTNFFIGIKEMLKSTSESNKGTNVISTVHATMGSIVIQIYAAHPYIQKNTELKISTPLPQQKKKTKLTLVFFRA